MSNRSEQLLEEHVRRHPASRGHGWRGGQANNSLLLLLLLLMFLLLLILVILVFLVMPLILLLLGFSPQLIEPIMGCSLTGAVWATSTQPLPVTAVYPCYDHIRNI